MDFKWILSYISVHRIFVLSINYDMNVFLFFIYEMHVNIYSTRAVNNLQN